MPVQEHLKGQWREWRHARVAELTRPYGWTALVAQYWLKDGEEGTVLDLLPGPEISMQVVGIAAAAAQVNVQTL